MAVRLRLSEKRLLRKLAAEFGSRRAREEL